MLRTPFSRNFSFPISGSLSLPWQLQGGTACPQTQCVIGWSQGPASWAPQPPSPGMWNPSSVLLSLTALWTKREGSLALLVALLCPVDGEGDKPVGGKREKESIGRRKRRWEDEVGRGRRRRGRGHDGGRAWVQGLLCDCEPPGAGLLQSSLRNSSGNTKAQG